MRRVVEIGAVVLLCAANIFVIAARMGDVRTSTAGPPQKKFRVDKLPSESVLELVGDRIDIGRVIEGTKKRVEFRVKNISNGPVEVTSVRTTCSCFSKVGDVRGSFGPGEIRVIEMDLQPRSGTSSWPVLVQTNCRQQYRFEANGASYVDARAEPNRIELGEVVVLSTTDRKVAVQGDDTTYFDSEDSAQASVDWIQASIELVPATEAAKKKRTGPYSKIAVVHLQIKPVDLGKFEEVVLVNLLSSATNERRVVPIAVTGRAVTEVVVRPEALRFDSNSTEPKLLKLRSLDGPFEVKAYRSDIVELVGVLPNGPVELLNLYFKPRKELEVDTADLVLDIVGKATISATIPVTIVKGE